MTREDIIRMVREASSGNDDRNIFFDLMIEELEAFAALVASAEREACAKVCESIDMESFGVLPVRAVMIANDCAEAIRARGNTKQFEPCPFIECDCDGNHPLNQPAIRARGQA